MEVSAALVQVVWQRIARGGRGAAVVFGQIVDRDGGPCVACHGVVWYRGDDSGLHGQTGSVVMRVGLLAIVCAHGTLVGMPG